MYIFSFHQILFGTGERNIIYLICSALKSSLSEQLRGGKHEAGSRADGAFLYIFQKGERLKCLLLKLINGISTKIWDKLVFIFD